MHSEKKFKMCALDLDGTLLNSSHCISETSVKCLQRLHGKGFKIAIASGRSPAACAEVIQRLDLHDHVSGFPVVTTNGARGIHVFKNKSLVGLDTKKLLKQQDRHHNHDDDESNNPMIDGRMILSELFHQPVPMDITIKTLELAKTLGCVTNYYIEHDIVAHADEESHFAATKKYTELTGVPFVYVKDNYQSAMKRGLPSKLIILCCGKDVDTVYEHADRVLGAHAKVIRGSPPWFVEVLHKDVNKGVGLQMLCDRLHVNLEEVITFGDGDNDIEFLQMSGLGIAMKNARETVKAIADLETDHCNDEDGVICMLEKLETQGKLHLCND
jgi:Cof subfamily protein (haloacid dehalogenase superfamily)